MFIVLGQKVDWKSLPCSEWILRKFLNRNNCFKDAFPIHGKKAVVKNHSGYSRLGMVESNFIPQGYNEETADL